ncbi:hypothetical protein F5B20DRAFT_564807 [Whalleya microplaca]|nr:hypothetical protein F5B20DRAFT_564807 [Whalleya microplaca]
MRSLCILRSPWGRHLLCRPSYIVKRQFSGRPESSNSDESEPTLIPKTPARTRFAPSPTGYLHIGSLRTALYNYLLAKKTGGQFLLRIEDTDQSRLVPDAEPRLYEDLKWAGLSWDEGPDIGGKYGPYKQSERLGIYKKHADQLINDDRAYRCFCSPEELDRVKALNLRNNTFTAYPGTCWHIPPEESAQRAADGEEHCVRFKCDHTPNVRDLVYGLYRKPPGTDEDFIIIKRDGYPTYHFANVVDDHLMEITHVIRGAEWLMSTPKHMALYEGFGWAPPRFAHVGLLTNKARQKLSKRQGDIDISSWRDKAILPIALLNYVALLGWSPPRESRGSKGSDVLDMEQMISQFHLGFTKGNVTINDKLNFLQRSHIQKLAEKEPQKLYDQLAPMIEAEIEKFEREREVNFMRQPASGLSNAETGPLLARAKPVNENDGAVVSRSYLQKVIALEVDQGSFLDMKTFFYRAQNLIWQMQDATYEEHLKTTARRPVSHKENVKEFDPDSDEAAAAEPRPVALLSDIVVKINELLFGIPEHEWTEVNIGQMLQPFLNSTESKLRDGWTPLGGHTLLRWILTAGKPGSGLFPSLELLGKEEALRRVEQARRNVRYQEIARGLL